MQFVEYIYMSILIAVHVWFGSRASQLSFAKIIATWKFDDYAPYEGHTSYPASPHNYVSQHFELGYTDLSRI